MPNCRIPYPRELADDWIALHAQRAGRGSAYHLAITGHEGEQEMLVGVVGLTLDAKRAHGRLGYWVGRAYWGHGVATEAAGRLTRWGFANLHLDRINAEVTTDNPASAAVLRRIGFRQTGGWHPALPAVGCDHQVLIFEATREDVFGRAEAAPAENAAGRSRCCWSPPARWSMSMAACCWRAGRKARRWPACGSSPAAS